MDEINITSAQYVQYPFEDSPSGIQATINGQKMFVPIDPANRHYIAIQKAVSDGQLTIQEADNG